MNLDLTEQDINNVQVSIIQMAKSGQTQEEAMKLLMVLHDKIKKQIQAQQPSVVETVQPEESVSDEEQNFTSEEFQEKAALAHMQAVSAKTE